MTTSSDRRLGALLGLAVGDALGTTYEFERLDQPPYPALATSPATDVVGGGPFELAPGAVTDDTQLAVCLARSLAELGQFDAADIARRYVAWAADAFDIGNQTAAALSRLAEGREATVAGRVVWHASGRRAAGNGSLMRTAPLAVWFGEPGEPLIDAAISESLITHADPRCAIACAAFDAAIAAGLADPAGMAGAAERALHHGASRLRAAWHDDPDDLAAIDAAEHDLASDLEAATASEPGVHRAGLDLHRTAGFVRVAFRLAFWHLHHTASWRAAVTDVASRGGDADTNGAIVGALLGARDGAAAIPEAWRARVLGATQKGPAAWGEAHHPRHLVALVGGGARATRG